jgi:hypothetical protein
MRRIGAEPEGGSLRLGHPLLEWVCIGRAEGIANLSNHRDYSQIVKHVNSIWHSPVALTSFLDRTSSWYFIFLTQTRTIAQTSIVAQSTYLRQSPPIREEFTFSLSLSDRPACPD